MITISDLRKIMPHCPQARAEKFIDALNDAMHEFDIISPAREQAFLAQIAHESGELLYTREIWGPTAAQQKYEGRLDLGNTEPGDGERFKGRGLIQITGRANYSVCSEALFADAKFLVKHPEELEKPVLAARSAAWFWKEHGCNEMADDGDFRTITRRINGGVNGYAQRLAFYRRAEETLV